MAKRNWKKWAEAAAVRAVRTMAQAALAMITVGQPFFEVGWGEVASIALTAGIYSILTSIGGLPEVDAKKAAEAKQDE